MQNIGLISFVPAKGATPNDNGVFGFAKLRGNFSTNIDMVIHNNEAEISPLILKVFSDERFYQKKVLKIISDIDLLEADKELLEAMKNKSDESAKNIILKILSEPRTIAINTMRYGAPLEEN